MLDTKCIKIKLVTANRKWYVATVCHHTEEGGKVSSLTGRGACDFWIKAHCGKLDSKLVNNNSDRPVLHTLANNNKGRESSARNVEIILMTHRPLGMLWKVLVLLQIACNLSWTILKAVIVYFLWISTVTM
jgi:hypothetical protein